MMSELDTVRILRNQNVNHTEGVAQRHNPPRSWEEIWLLLCGGDPRGSLDLSSFGGRTGPSYPGHRDKERKLMHQGRLGPGDHVPRVVSDPLWPTGKQQATAGLSGTVSQPWPGSFTGHKGG